MLSMSGRKDEGCSFLSLEKNFIYRVSGEFQAEASEMNRQLFQLGTQAGGRVELQRLGA